MKDSVTHIKKTIAEQLVGKTKDEATDVLASLFTIANHASKVADAYQNLEVDTEQAALLNSQMHLLLSINLELLHNEINEEREATNLEPLDDAIFYHQIYLALKHTFFTLKYSY